MTDLELKDAATGIQEEWGFQIPGTLSEETILNMLETRVIQLIEMGAETFIPMMYRLDISEAKLHGVLNEADVAQKIARLIYDRQLQKMASRKLFASQADSDDPELKW